MCEFNVVVFERKGASLGNKRLKGVGISPGGCGKFTDWSKGVLSPDRQSFIELGPITWINQGFHTFQWLSSNSLKKTIPNYRGQFYT